MNFYIIFQLFIKIRPSTCLLDVLDGESWWEGLLKFLGFVSILDLQGVKLGTRVLENAKVKNQEMFAILFFRKTKFGFSPQGRDKLTPPCFSGAGIVRIETDTPSHGEFSVQIFQNFAYREHRTLNLVSPVLLTLMETVLASFLRAFKRKSLISVIC